MIWIQSTSITIWMYFVRENLDVETIYARTAIWLIIFLSLSYLKSIDMWWICFFSSHRIRSISSNCGENDINSSSSSSDDDDNNNHYTSVTVEFHRMNRFCMCVCVCSVFDISTGEHKCGDQKFQDLWNITSNFLNIQFSLVNKLTWNCTLKSWSSIL